MDKLTAAEFAAIGERVERLAKLPISYENMTGAEQDRAVLHATLERLIGRCVIQQEDDTAWYVNAGNEDEQTEMHATKDDAIDELLGGGK